MLGPAVVKEEIALGTKQGPAEVTMREPVLANSYHAAMKESFARGMLPCTSIMSSTAGVSSSFIQPPLMMRSYLSYGSKALQKITV